MVTDSTVSGRGDFAPLYTHNYAYAYAHTINIDILFVAAVNPAKQMHPCSCSRQEVRRP